MKVQVLRTSLCFTIICIFMEKKYFTLNFFFLYVYFRLWQRKLRTCMVFNSTQKHPIPINSTINLKKIWTVCKPLLILFACILLWCVIKLYLTKKKYWFCLFLNTFITLIVGVILKYTVHLNLSDIETNVSSPVFRTIFVALFLSYLFWHMCQLILKISCSGQQALSMCASIQVFWMPMSYS